MEATTTIMSSCPHCRGELPRDRRPIHCPHCGADLSILSTSCPMDTVVGEHLPDQPPSAPGTLPTTPPSLASKRPFGPEPQASLASPVTLSNYSRVLGETLAADDPLVGTGLAVYQIESLLGRGGMGRVYLAKHGALDRKCALKILAPSRIALDEDYVTRFLNEGRAAAALVHPNIVTVHAIGEAHGLHYLEMEFIAGQSLHQVIRAEGRLTPTRSTALAVRIAEGLALAHRQGVIHRDIKPDNVMLTHNGIPKIADFGLAKRVRSGDGRLLEGLLGTPNFMAPELFAGEQATPASDVYALGVTYFLMLTGRYPFFADSLTNLMAQVVHEPTPSVRSLCPDVTLEMAECLSLLMAKEPANRPRDGIEAAQLLHAVLGHVRDVEDLLQEAFAEDKQVRWSRTGDRYKLQLELPDGRRQTLYVESSEDAAPDRLLLIYSICCDANPAYYEFALRLNSEIRHGGLAIRDIDGAPRFVLIETFPRITCGVEEIRRSVIEVAYRADGVEQLLTDADHY